MSTREIDIKEATDKEPTYKKTVDDLMVEYQPVSPEPKCQTIVTKICTMMLSGLNPKEESMVDKDNGYSGDEIKAEYFLDKYDINKKCTGAYIANILKKKAFWDPMLL